MTIDAVTPTSPTAPVARSNDASPTQRPGEFDRALATAEAQEPEAGEEGHAAGPVSEKAGQSMEASGEETSPDGNPSSPESPIFEACQAAGADVDALTPLVVSLVAPLGATADIEAGALNPELSLRLGRSASTVVEGLEMAQTPGPGTVRAGGMELGTVRAGGMEPVATPATGPLVPGAADATGVMPQQFTNKLAASAPAPSAAPGTELLPEPREVKLQLPDAAGSSQALAAGIDGGPQTKFASSAVEGPREAPGTMSALPAAGVATVGTDTTSSDSSPKDLAQGEGQRQPETSRTSQPPRQGETASEAKASTTANQTNAAQLVAEALADEGAPPAEPAKVGDALLVPTLTGVAAAATSNPVTPGQRPELQTSFPAALRELLAELAEPPGEVRFKVDGHSFTAQVLADADGHTEVRLLSSESATRSFLEDRHSEVRRALDQAGFRDTDVAYGQREERGPRDTEQERPPASDEDEAQVPLSPRKMRPNDARLRATLAARTSRLHIIA